MKGLVGDLIDSSKEIPTAHNSDYRSAGYKLPPKMWRTDGDSSQWWYIVAISVEESEVQKETTSTEDKMKHDGILLLGFTAASAVLTIIIITIFIILLARRITEPLIGLCQFANKINANATEKNLVSKEDLDALVDGED